MSAKEPYVKPVLERIELSPEERLASCEFFYKTGLGFSGCRTSFFEDVNPASCLILTTPQSVS